MGVGLAGCMMVNVGSCIPDILHGALSHICAADTLICHHCTRPLRIKLNLGLGQKMV